MKTDGRQHGVERTLAEGDILPKKLNLMSKLTVLLIFAVGTLSGFGYWLWELADSYDSMCRQVTALAQDSQKMMYVRRWAAARLNDPSFMNAVRRYRWFARDNPNSEGYIDLDWSYLGFDPQLTKVEFNIKDPETHVFDTKEIGSISLYEGRSSIIIGLTGEAGLGLNWPPDARSRLKSVGNSVFVYCSG